MRVYAAGLIGGILMFIWDAAAHTALGLGDAGLKLPANGNVVLSTLHQGLGAEPDVYILPSINPSQMNDRAVVQAYAEKAKASPYTWVVHLPQGEDLTQMGRQLPRQCASDTLAALALAFVMGLAGLGLPAAHRAGRGGRGIRLAEHDAAALELVSLSTPAHPGRAGRTATRLADCRCRDGLAAGSKRTQAGALSRSASRVTLARRPVFIAAIANRRR